MYSPEYILLEKRARMDKWLKLPWYPRSQYSGWNELDCKKKSISYSVYQGKQTIETSKISYSAKLDIELIPKPILFSIIRNTHDWLYDHRLDWSLKIRDSK